MGEFYCRRCGSTNIIENYDSNNKNKRIFMNHRTNHTYKNGMRCFRCGSWNIDYDAS